MLQIRFLSLFILLTNISLSQDRLFTYVYQSNVLVKGQREIETTNTFHWGRENYYRALKHRFELEAGLGKHLQTAFYLNIETEAFQESKGEKSYINSDLSISFSNEWKYKFTDPVANGFGSALYGEYTISKDEIEIEARVILDKKTGKFMHALNLIAEPEFKSIVENDNTSIETEFAFEADYGLSYYLSNNFKLGFEIVNKNKSGEEHGWEYSTLYGGPCFSYLFDKNWINFSFMPQIAGLYYYKKDGMINGKVLDENEKLQTRLIFSFAF